MNYNEIEFELRKSLTCLEPQAKILGNVSAGEALEMLNDKNWQINNLRAILSKEAESNTVDILEIQSLKNCLGRIINRCGSLKNADTKGLLISIEQDAIFTLNTLEKLKPKTETEGL